MHIDIDNLTGRIDGDTVTRWREAGVTAVWVGLQDPPPQYPPFVADQQIQTLVENGMPIVGVYAESQPIWDTWHKVAQWQDHIPQVYVSCEEDWMTAQVIRDSLSFIRSINKPAGIYTGAWWWEPHFHYSTEFTYLPLWAAQYDGLPYHPFGGWQSPTYMQTAADENVGGANVDVDSGPDPVPPEVPVQYKQMDQTNAIRYIDDFNKAAGVLIETEMFEITAGSGLETPGYRLFVQRVPNERVPDIEA